jgi:cytochrome c5
MHEHDKHASSIAHLKGPVIATGVALIVTIAVLVLLTQMVTDTPKVAKDDEAAVLSRIKPVGDVQLAIASAPKGQLSGEQVYNQVCKTCHEGGLAGAPKVGDTAAWGKVIAQGLALTVDHALKGIRAMPPKGGNPDFENIEIERAVVFMAGKAGANWKEPPAAIPPAAAPTAAPAAAPAMAAAASASGKPDGKKIYDATCTVCHGAGVAGAPKFGDKAAWTPRVKTGIDALYASALKGKATMPAKGGNTSLSDAEVKAAVDYMAAASK